MPKETQKAKIKRLEKDVLKYKELCETTRQKFIEYQNKADNDFSSNPYKIQLENKLITLKELIKSHISLLNSTQKREQAKDKEIIRLNKRIEELQKLIDENKNIPIYNVRGAGRKPKFTEKEISDIREQKQQGSTLSELAKKYGCSIGLIYKLINENK